MFILLFFSTDLQVTDLMRRSIYRMRLRYSLDVKPSSVQMSNMVSETPKNIIRLNRRSTPRNDSFSVEEVSNIF